MCSPWAGAGLGLKALGMYQGWQAEDNYAKAQAKAAVRSMNYDLQNYNQQRVDAYDSALSELQKLNVNALQLNSQVEAAVNEDYAGGGRTADSIMRHSVGDTARAASSIQENYLRQASEILLNKEYSVLSTRNYIKGLRGSTQKSRYADLLGLGVDALNAYNTQREVNEDYKSRVAREHGR